MGIGREEARLLGTSSPVLLYLSISKLRIPVEESEDPSSGVFHVTRGMGIGADEWREGVCPWLFKFISSLHASAVNARSYIANSRGFLGSLIPEAEINEQEDDTKNHLLWKSIITLIKKINLKRSLY